MRSLIVCAFGLFATQMMFGQNVLVKELAKHWETSKALTLAVADAMPEDSYSFKATEAEMSFGGLMNHIAQSDTGYCSLALGEKPAAAPETGEPTKAKAVEELTKAFDYCIAGINKMSDADLTKEVTARGKPSTPFTLLWGAFTHTAHHRGQAEVYLRLKGVTPPAYKF